jgi:hypothetical protein
MFVLTPCSCVLQYLHHKVVDGTVNTTDRMHARQLLYITINGLTALQLSYSAFKASRDTSHDQDLLSEREVMNKVTLTLVHTSLKKIMTIFTLCMT